jgi:hypothetical protein
MKYVIVKTFEDRIVKLTRPSTRKQAHNSFERFKDIGLTNIRVVPSNKVPKIDKQETSDEFLKAKKDFEAEL